MTQAQYNTLAQVDLTAAEEKLILSWDDLADEFEFHISPSWAIITKKTELFPEIAEFIALVDKEYYNEVLEMLHRFARI